MPETLWKRLTRGARRLYQHPRWPHFLGLDWPEHIMAVPVTDRFHAKQGRTIGRCVFEKDDRRLVVYLKRHYRLPWWHGLMALLFPRGNWSPALQEWKHLEWAREKGLPVPTAMAAGEYIGPWGRLQSFLAVEELTGMLPLHQAIPLAASRLDPPTFRKWKRGLIRELVRLVKALHDHSWFHKDLYLCHFYIREEECGVPSVKSGAPSAECGAHVSGAPRSALRAPHASWQGRVHMIDLHRLGHHPWTNLWWQSKDLAQLLYSSEVEGVDARDRLYFWRLYRGKAGGGLAQRLFLWNVRLRWWSYRRHNRKRKLSPPSAGPTSSL